MKKILILAAIMLLPFSSLADTKSNNKNNLPYKYEVDITWGGMPVLSMSELGGSLAKYEIDDMMPKFGMSLNEIYGPYEGDTRMTGLLSADFNIQFKRWLAMGLQLNSNVIYSSYYSSFTDEKLDTEQSFMLSFVPYVRFTYLNRPVVKLYSAVGFGASFMHKGDVYSGYEKFMFYPAFQLTPIGVMVGRTVYGIFELGMGTELLGVRAGIGYRF